MAYKIIALPGCSYYLYDREINKVIKIENSDAATLNGLLGKEAFDFTISKLQNQGFCLPTKLNKIVHPDTIFLKQFLGRRVEELVLQVTQNCNLRCEYCSYSGSYYNRVHSNIRMSLETAICAVDFMMARSLDEKDIHIGFYGGEPLLEMDLISKVVNYISNEYEGKSIHYSLTTNATLLSDDLSDFFARHSFHLMFSIDGPQNVHDSHRRFVQGNGSFDKLMGNLSRLKNRHPDYFKKLSTNTVISPDQDFNEVVNFLTHDNIIKDLTHQISFISDLGSKMPVYYPNEVDYIMYEGHTKLFLYLLGYLERDDVPQVFFSYLTDLLYMYRIFKSNGPILSEGHPGGPCTPGVRRFFVDAEGTFFPCERVGEIKGMRIGNLSDGFDEQKISDIINVGSITEDECKKCWAFSFCEQCVGFALDGGKVSKAKRLSRCPGIKANIEKKFRDLFFLIENGVDFEKDEELQRK